MRLLLDTHALLWWWTDDPRLPGSVRSRVLDVANEVWVSAASAWEIATKERIGTLSASLGATARFGELIAADRFQALAITPSHALRAGAYPIDHRDPFDRMLAAQAELDGFVLVTRDPVFEQFECRTVW